jgi:hypothetical protein
MEDGDNNAVVRCTVMQELLASDVYQQTAPISVFCKYMLRSLEINLFLTTFKSKQVQKP